MALLYSMQKYKLILYFRFLFSITCFFFYSGCVAEDNPVYMFEKALICFNNKIYGRCDEAYRLNEGGSINVPPEAMNLFCRGPCFAETQLVLNCIENTFSDFLFHNKATVHDIRGTLLSGCSYTSDKGIFNWRGYMQGETSNVQRLLNPMVFSAIMLVTSFCYFIIH